MKNGRLYLEMRDYIEANYSDATLNVNALSEHFDRPAPFVSRYFKEMNGTNLTQYIHKVRLEHVKEKLLQDEKFRDDRRHLRVWQSAQLPAYLQTI